MYMVNKFGILHSMPDGAVLPAGARLATEAEVKAFEETGVQEVAKMKLETAKKSKDKDPTTT